jgi:hypothetical protein
LVAQAAEVQQPNASEVLERAADRSSAGQGEPFDARAFRRSLNSTGRYTRKPSNDPDSLSLMEEHGVGYSTSGLVAQMREQGYSWRQGDVTVKLAEAYGFCWGVERAVQMAYEARRAYPNQRLHITNEIIHNPGGRGWRPVGLWCCVFACCWAGSFVECQDACRCIAQLPVFTSWLVECSPARCSLNVTRLTVCLGRREPAAQGDGRAVHRRG